MLLADAHCHLLAPELADRLDAVLAAARAAGVAKLVNNTVSPGEWAAAAGQAARHPEVAFAWGVHPWDASPEHLGCMDRLRGARDAGASAIGEIGLDANIEVPMDLQEQLFVAQLDVARDLDLPVAIHCRGAFNDLQRILHRRGPLAAGGIVHAFSGSLEVAEDLMARGLSFSMGASLSYRPGKKRQAVLEAIWPDHLLLETDSPDMPPAQAPGRPNTPANIVHNLGGLANYVDAPLEELAAVTTRNTARVFRLDIQP